MLVRLLISRAERTLAQHFSSLVCQAGCSRMKPRYPTSPAAPRNNLTSTRAYRASSTSLFSSSCSSSSSSRDDIVGEWNMPFNRLTFVSDIEGNYDYWTRFTASSLAFKQSDNIGAVEDPSNLQLNDGYGLVYVGDVCDHGDGDLRLLKDLISLKDRYKNRVFFVLGNRDVNKLRLLTELDDLTIKGELNAGVFYKEVDNQEKPWIDKADKLKWMLCNNMGSADSFEKRRKELCILLNKDEISDKEVMQSYLDLIDPKWFVSKFSKEFYYDSDEVNELYSKEVLSSSSGASRFQLEYGGLLLKYMRQANLCLQIGDVLIVHGGLNDNNMGWLPPSRPEYSQWKSSPHHTFTASGHLLEIFSKITSSYIFNVSNFENSKSLGVYEDDFMADRLSEWIYRLEEFKNFEIEDYIRHSRDYIRFYNKDRNDKYLQQSHRLPKAQYWSGIGGYLHYQPGSRLIQYAMGSLLPAAKLPLATANATPAKIAAAADEDITRNRGVIYSNFLSDGMPSYIKDKTFRFLEHCDIRRIVVGHQPLGDSPLILNNRNSIDVVCLDTSHSRSVKWREISYGNYTNIEGNSSDTGGENDDARSLDDRRERLLGLDHQKLQTDTNTTIPFTDSYSYKSLPFADANVILKKIRESCNQNQQQRELISRAFREVRLDDTRGLTTGHVEIDFSEDREGYEIKSGNMTCYGVLSNGHSYYYQISIVDNGRNNKNKNNNDVNNGNSNSNNNCDSISRLVGKRTIGGWVMRAVGVAPILDPSPSLGECSSNFLNNALIAPNESRGNKFVLLSYIKGYDVYNRYILPSDIKHLEWI